MSLIIENWTAVFFFLNKITVHLCYKVNNSNKWNKWCGPLLTRYLLNFSLHIQNITNKALSKLGFFKRLCKDFHGEHALKT